MFRVLQEILPSWYKNENILFKNKIKKKGWQDSELCQVLVSF